jgi:ubiquinone/menaquinone biosynthesis C-methylase UbiE
VTSSYVTKAIRFLEASGLRISGPWIDCGCGQGYYLEALSSLGAEPVVGIDIHYSYLEKIPFFCICGRCEQLPLKDTMGSGCLLVNVLHYFPHPQPIVEEAWRVLYPQGTIVIIEYDQSTPTSWNPYPLSVRLLTSLLTTCRFSGIYSIRVDKTYRPKHMVIGEKT